MLIILEDGNTVMGSEIYQAIFRSSLEPVPCTFEARIKVHAQNAPFLVEGKVIKAGLNQTPMNIVYARDGIASQEQNGVVIIRHIIALHDNSKGIAYRLAKPVIREKVSLSEIYQSCGGKSNIGKDFIVPRFYCYRGFLPSQQIALICQEHGGVVRWNAEPNTLAFTRIYDLFNQQVKVHKPLQNSAQRSEFLERHEVPSYITCDKNGGIIKGNFDKPHSVRYSPHKTEAELYAASSVLVNAKTVPSEYAPSINAGDIVQEGEIKFVVITAAHSIARSDGATDDKSVFWLGVKS